MQRRLALYVVRTQALGAREEALRITLQTVQAAAEAAGYEFASALVLGPDPPALQARIKELEGAIDYSPVGDAELDPQLRPLSLQELSCMEKHREAWRRIAAAPADDGLHCVMEDDVVLLPNFGAAFGRFLGAPAAADWELLLLGGGGAALAPLVAKEAYCLSPAGAAALDAGLAKIKFSTRLYLSWCLKQARVRGRCAPERMTADGSKLGVFASATRINNALVQHEGFMELMALVQQTAPLDGARINALLPPLVQLRAPDASHLLGVLQYRLGRYETARDLFMDAIHQMMAQHGLLTVASDLMKNAISVHRHLQPDLAELKALPSRYANAPLLS